MNRTLGQQASTFCYFGKNKEFAYEGNSYLWMLQSIDNVGIEANVQTRFGEVLDPFTATTVTTLVKLKIQAVGEVDQAEGEVLIPATVAPAGARLRTRLKVA